MKWILPTCSKTILKLNKAFNEFSIYLVPQMRTFPGFDLSNCIKLGTLHENEIETELFAIISDNQVELLHLFPWPLWRTTSFDWKIEQIALFLPSRNWTTKVGDEISFRFAPDLFLFRPLIWICMDKRSGENVPRKRRSFVRWFIDERSTFFRMMNTVMYCSRATHSTSSDLCLRSFLGGDVRCASSPLPGTNIRSCSYKHIFL